MRTAGGEGTEEGGLMWRTGGDTDIRISVFPSPMKLLVLPSKGVLIGAESLTGELTVRVSEQVPRAEM